MVIIECFIGTIGLPHALLILALTQLGYMVYGDNLIGVLKYHPTFFEGH